MDAPVRPVRLVGPVLIALGIAALALAFLQGQATLSLFVIFPVVTATGAWAFLGILLMIAGFFLFFLTIPSGSDHAPGSGGTTSSSPAPGVLSKAPPDSPPRRWGGVVFVGPVPVVFGSDAKVTRWMLVLGLVLFVALVVFTVISLWGI